MWATHTLTESILPARWMGGRWWPVCVCACVCAHAVCVCVCARAVCACSCRVCVCTRAVCVCVCVCGVCVCVCVWVYAYCFVTSAVLQYILTGGRGGGGGGSIIKAISPHWHTLLDTVHTLINNQNRVKPQCTCLYFCNYWHALFVFCLF